MPSHEPFALCLGSLPHGTDTPHSFMALDPHPCPEVIYWAADSKQLVVAQPERVR